MQWPDPIGVRSDLKSAIEVACHRLEVSIDHLAVAVLPVEVPGKEDEGAAPCRVDAPPPPRSRHYLRDDAHFIGGVDVVIEPFGQE